MWQWEVRGVAIGGKGVAIGGKGVAMGGKGCDNFEVRGVGGRRDGHSALFCVLQSQT